MVLRRFATLSLMACLTVVPSASGAVVAEFTDGNGIATPDQWTGTAGAGWETAWAAASSDVTTGVTSTTPLNGGGNYLQFVKAATALQPYIRRNVSATADVDMSQPHKVSMSFRYDADLATFTAFSDRIAIFGDTAAVGGSATTNTWLIGVAGGNGGAGTGQSVYPGNWYFFDNNGSNSFSTSNMVDTGLALVEDRVYQITVDVNPAAGTYSAMIDDGVNPIVSASDLTFRRGSAATPTWFHIVANSGGSDDAAFSLDNLTIVPEPASLGLLGVATLGMLARRRRIC